MCSVWVSCSGGGSPAGPSPLCGSPPVGGPLWGPPLRYLTDSHSPRQLCLSRAHHTGRSCIKLITSRRLRPPPPVSRRLPSDSPFIPPIGRARLRLGLGFTRYCYYPYWMVDSIQTGVRGGGVYCPIIVQSHCTRVGNARWAGG